MTVNRITWILLGCCACFALVSRGAAAEGLPNTVVEVRVEGNERLSKNAVLSYVKTRVGTTYDDAAVKADRDRLSASGRFSNVTVTRTPTDKGVIVTFKVAERATIGRISLLGAKHYTETELRKDLPISEGDPLSAASIQAGKRALLNKYHGDGFYFVEITVVDSPPAEKDEVIYRIVEGPRAIIKKVLFEGNHYFKDITLKLKAETKAKFWPFLNGALNVEKLDRDVQTIRNVYINEGFLDAEVGRRLDFSDDKNSVRVTFLVKEGPRYRINKVVFNGNTVFSSQELAGRLRFEQGAFYTTEKLRLDLKSLEFAYGELGYIDADVKSKKRFLAPQAPVPEWARDVDGGKPALLNLVFDVVENDQYRIGAIHIRGNSITQERVIRREFRFRPEQLYDTVAVEFTKNRLKELRYFDEVNIAPVDTDQKSVKDILVEVKEGRTAEFLIGVGISTNSGLLGTVSFTQRNFDFLSWPKSFKQFIKAESFKGAGQRLEIKAEPGSEMMVFTVGWSTPYIFDLPYSLAVKGYLFDRDYDNGYDETRLGVLASFGHQFKNRWYGEVGTRLEGIDIKSSDYSAVEILEDDGNHTLVGFRGNLIRDRTDSRWKPTEGDRFEFGYEQVVGSYTFGRFNSQYKMYHTTYVDSLDRKHVLAGRVAYGQIVGDAPVFERFYGGGIGSIRGFKYRGISPRGHWPNGAIHRDAIGGDMMFFAGTEYTYPILADQLSGVFFLDSGTVEEEFEFTTYRVAIGFGFRWVIPFFGDVPMAFDFGFPLVKDDDDRTQIFSFSLGWTF
ncbi:MAG: outer membrane protein assembly factor BamA [Phycisphaerae bacterium]|nr:outer membrane protein assembly factor BamA [Phycisphaerae bacterium]